MDMNVILIVLIILLSIILIICIKNIKKQNQIINRIRSVKNEELKDIFKESWDNEERKFSLKKADLLIQEEEIENKIAQLNVIFSEKENQYKAINQDLDFYREGKIEEIDRAAAEYKKRKLLLTDTELIDYTKSKTKEINNYLDTLEEKQKKKELEIKQIQEELEVERSKRAAINEEIRKSEEKEKYNEIHSVQLTDNEKEDIHFLLSLEDRLHNKQPLYKLIWSTYLQQAYKNTFNNILGNRSPKNVIYCIENINTGKKYIGKTSAEVSKRWTEHIKTSLNIGTIKTTNIHKALYNHWDEFIFYILTETEKDKLSEMEKYYINFYESDKYGYNIKAGG